jgi:fibronectin-binding autotransporter adhesin
LSSGTMAVANRQESINAMSMSGGNLTISSGTLTLGAAGSTSSFTGGNVIISVSTGRINTNGTTTLGNATFDYTNASVGSAGLALGGDIVVNANSTANFTISGGSTTRIILMDANRVFDIGSGGNMNVGWRIRSVTDSLGALTKNGSGTLTLTAQNLYGNGTTINDGTLVLGTATDTLAAGAVIINGGTLSIGSNSDTVGAVTLAGGNITGSTGVLTGSSYALQSGNVTAILGGTGAATKTTAGTVILSGANTYTGATTINAGTLRIGSITNGSVAGTLGNSTNAASNLVLGGGTLEYTGSNASTDRNFTLTNGTTSVVSITQSTETLTISGTSATGNGSLTKAGAGTLALSGANNHSGNTTVNAGTLAVANVNALQNSTLDTGTSGSQAVTFTVAGTNTYNIGGLQGSDALNIGANSLSVGANNADTVFNGVLSGTGNFTKNGTGSLTLGGANTISTGTISLGAGTTLIGDNAAFGTATLKFGVSGSSTFTIASTDSTDRTISNSLAGISGVSTITFGQASGGTGNLTFSNSVNVSLNNASRTFNVLNTTAFTGNLIHSGASLIKTGAGTLILLGNNTYGSSTGATTISAGTLQIGVGGGTGSIASSSIVNNSALLVDRTGTLTLSGNMSGSGTLTKNGSGILVLSGSNSQSGTTTLNAGTITLQSSNALGTGSLTQASGSSLLLIDTTGTISNTISVYNVQASQSATLSGAITVNNATFDVDPGDTLTISGGVGGTGGVTKNGTGTLVLSGSNTYSGATVVNSGTLNAAASGALGSTPSVTVNNGGSLLVSANGSLGDATPVLLGSGTATGGLVFGGDVGEVAGALTLTSNSVIDMGSGAAWISFDSLTSVLTSNTQLQIWNYTPGSDGVYFRNSANVQSSLGFISFYSGAGTGTFFNALNTASFSAPELYPTPVPEAETYATALLLLCGFCIYSCKKLQRARARCVRQVQQNARG